MDWIFRFYLCSEIWAWMLRNTGRNWTNHTGRCLGGSAMVSQTQHCLNQQLQTRWPKAVPLLCFVTWPIWYWATANKKEKEGREIGIEGGKETQRLCRFHLNICEFSWKAEYHANPTYIPPDKKLERISLLVWACGPYCATPLIIITISSSSNTSSSNSILPSRS